MGGISSLETPAITVTCRFGLLLFNRKQRALLVIKFFLVIPSEHGQPSIFVYQLLRLNCTIIIMLILLHTIKKLDIIVKNCRRTMRNIQFGHSLF